MSLDNLHNNNPIYNDQRFARLSEKINKMQNLEIEAPTKVSKIENKLDYLDINVNKSFKDYEYKYKFLNDELIYINRLMDINKDTEENYKAKISYELKNMENKIKIIFEQEREESTNMINDLFKHVENEFLLLQMKHTKEKNEIVQDIQNLRNVLDYDTPILNSKIEKITEDRNNIIQSLVNTMEDESKYVNNLV